MRNVIALVHGGIYLLVGILGLVFNPLGGLMLGIFAVNPFHHVFHLALGALGVTTARLNRGRLYCQVAGVILLVLGVLGFVAPTLVAALIADPNANIVTDNLLHLVTGTALAYFGFLPETEVAPTRQIEQRVNR
jgi:uncharacterized protein DUF4383